jgi:putative SOS response-associated peptidase YedK
MCGRFTSLLSPGLLSAIFGIIPQPITTPRYNIAPTQFAEVIRSNGQGNELVPMRWGLIPHWFTKSDFIKHMINARSENVSDRPAFRHALQVSRCIIPASGFYEWKHIGDKKLPYYINMADGGIMAFAGIWERWMPQGGGDTIESFCILTTDSNELIAPVHDRMPVILQPENYELWLNRNVHRPIELQHLYSPFPADQFSMHRVTETVNNPQNNGPECIERIRR